MQVAKRVETAVRLLMDHNAKRVTVFDQDQSRVRVSRLVFKGRFSRKAVELVVSVGKPNFEEREFLAWRKRQGLKGGTAIWVKHLPKKAKR